MMRPFLMFIMVCFYSAVSSQSIEVELTISPDNFPQDIRWEIIDASSSLILSNTLEDCTPFEICTETFSLSDECYSFIIYDSNNDGISQPGYFELKLNGELVIVNASFNTVFQSDLNCNIGESCSKAIPIVFEDDLTILNWTKEKESWFSFQPSESGLYNISTCPNFSSGRLYANTEMWVYETCDRLIRTEGAEGAIGYSDNNNECPPGAGFNYLFLEGGIEYYFRLRFQGQTWEEDSLQLHFERRPIIQACTDPLACNYNPFASADDGSCIYDTCNPDLSLDREELRQSLFVDTIVSNDICLIEEGCLRGPGPREVIRFSTKIDNVGDADYIVGSAEQNPQNFSRENCHGHWHHTGYAEYLLFNGAGSPEPVGFKNGFCLLDLQCDSGSPQYLCNYMGVSAGCSDIYDTDVKCQWIDITDVEDGTYTLVVRVNWNRLPDIRGKYESTYDNNWGQVCINIDRSSGGLKLSILEECEIFTDCMGIEFGQAEIDCSGECGGSRKFGDVDESGEIGLTDVDLYLDALINKLNSYNVCADINSDGKVSLYDASVLQWCIDTSDDYENDPFHDHCVLPFGIDNYADSVIVSISELNEEEAWMDITMSISNKDLASFHITINDIHIDSLVYQLDGTAYFQAKNQNEILVFSNQATVMRNTNPEVILRVYFTRVGDSICINEKSESVNVDYERVVTVVSDDCYFLSSTNEAQRFDKIIIFPNPVQSFLKYQTQLKIEIIEIFNLTGEKLISKNVTFADDSGLNIGTLAKGIYVVKFIDDDFNSYLYKIIKP